MDLFPLQRPIKWGCSISPTLLGIALDVIFYILRDTNLSPRFKRLSLPNGDDLLNIQFANDTAFFVNFEENNVDYLMHNLNLFCEAFGARTAKEKYMLSGGNYPPK